MEMRYSSHPNDVKTFDTDRLRKEFLVETLFEAGKLNLVYSHIDRYIIGGAVPTGAELKLEADPKEIGADYFLERREIGIINVGGAGTVKVDGTVHEMASKDCLYVGKGNREVLLGSKDPAAPAKYYLLSVPAHAAYPTAKAPIDQAQPQHLGSIANSNERTIYKYIHADGIQSCQLVMGMTLLKPGNMWNTMPAHTHERRSEVYFYFDMQEDNVVFHFMGQPSETRHLVVRNEQVVISPTWSIHSGVGTGNYIFIWGMGGENQTFADMDVVAMKDLR